MVSIYSLLDALLSNRVPLVHPKTLLEEDNEENLTPKQLQDIAKELYRNRSSGNIRSGICNLIDKLDVLARNLKRVSILD